MGQRTHPKTVKSGRGRDNIEFRGDKYGNSTDAGGKKIRKLVNSTRN
jgi:hypothetical protein